MFFRPTTFSTTNMIYLVTSSVQVTESSAHRIDRSHSFYNPVPRVCFLCWLNATSNLKIKAGSILKLYSSNFYDNFYGV